MAPLVFIVKKWARIWDIIDARQGYLSSYNWQLMVIYYLQQCQPPILPSLQLLYQEYFDANENVLKYVNLPQACFNTVLMEKNRQTLGDLFKGFLEYYSNLKYERNVISIRLGKLIDLNLYSDKWYNVNIGVEEPFSRQNSAYSVYDAHGYNKIVNCLDQSSRILKKENILASLGITLNKVRSKSTRAQRSGFGKTKGSLMDSSVLLSPEDQKLT